jgi:hypothetical protein
MQDQELHAFIAAAMAKGASDRFIADLLKSAGWADKEIFAAFREHYEQATGLTLPVRRESGESARDAFFYLIVFSTLATWTTALGSLLFRLIDLWLPDPVALRGGYGYPYTRLDLSFQMACILVAFPVFLYVSRRINRAVADEPRNRSSGVRKWLTYLALVIAAGVLIGDAVTVLAYLLQGEITLRFVFKVIVVALIAAGVFRYYFGEVGAPQVETEPRRRRIFGSAAIAAVVTGIILGFTATGGPSTQRAAQADVQRVRDLNRIAETVRNAVLSGGASIPAALDHVPATRDYNDPETGAQYEYRPISTTAYELCATFALDNRSDARQRRSTFWLHTAGRQCFQLDAKTPIPPEY